MNIVLARIDDRLIHGQVATVWSKVTGCTRIIVCDDDVAKDTIRATLLKQVAPAGIKSHVVDLEKVTGAVSVDDQDIESFKKLNEKGIELEIRKVDTDKKVMLMDVLK